MTARAERRYWLILSLLTASMLGCQSPPETPSIDPGLVFRGVTGLEPRGDTAIFNNGRYGVTFYETGAVEFAQASTKPGEIAPRLRMTLSQVTVGGAAVGNPVPSRMDVFPDEDRVDYDRGTVTERYLLLPEDLEQIFIFTSLPSTADLSIEIAVETNTEPPPDGTEGPSLTFTLGPRRIEIRDIVIYDANGESLELPFQWSAGLLKIVVPSAWVAQAALPLTLDPTLGAPLVVDSSTGGAFGRPARVAYNSVNDEWLVAWNEQVGASAFDWDIYAQRISSTGTLAGAPILVAGGPAAACELSVAYSPTANRYFVAWRGDPADDGSPADAGIYGRVINGGTGTFATAAAYLDGGVLDDYNPDVEWCGTNFYLAFCSVVDATNQWDIRGSLWSTAMVSAGVGIDADTTSLLRADNPALAYHSATGQCLVAWEAGASGGLRSLYYRILSPSTATFSAPAVELDQATTLEALHPGVGAGPNGWMVSWDEFADPMLSTSGAVMARMVGTGGAPTGASFLVSSTSYGAFWAGIATTGSWPAVEYSTSAARFLVVWHDHVASFDSLRMLARRYTSAGAVSGGQETILSATATSEAGWASLAARSSGGQFLISSWDSWSPGVVRVQRYTPNASSNAATQIVVLSAVEAAPGSSNQVVVTVQAQDASGNPTPVLTTYRADIVLTGAATGPARVTLNAGQTSQTRTINDTVAEVVGMSLLETTGTGLSEVSGTVTFIPGPATRVRVMPTSESGTGADASVTVTIRVEDANANSVSTHPAYAANVNEADALTVLNPTSISIPDGTPSVTITATETGNSVHTTTITLSETSSTTLTETSGTVVWLNATNGQGTKVVVLSAVEPAPGNSNQATVQIQVQNDVGTPITSHPTYSAQVQLTGTATSNSTITINSGTSTVNLNINDNDVEVVTVTLVETTGTGLVGVPGTATFIPGPAVRVRVLNASEPAPGDTNSVTVTIMVRDNNNNPQPNHAPYTANVLDNRTTAWVTPTSIFIPNGVASVTVTVSNTGIASVVTVSLQETSATSLQENSGQVTFVQAP